MNEDEQQPPCPGHTGCTPGDGQAIQHTEMEQPAAGVQGERPSEDPRSKWSARMQGGGTNLGFRGCAFQLKNGPPPSGLQLVHDCLRTYDEDRVLAFSNRTTILPRTIYTCTEQNVLAL